MVPELRLSTAWHNVPGPPRHQYSRIQQQQLGAFPVQLHRDDGQIGIVQLERLPALNTR